MSPNREARICGRCHAGRFTLGLVVVLAMLCAPGAAGAATIDVTTTADEFNSGSRCSLREAVWVANNDSTAMVQGCAAGSGGDVIVLPPGRFVLNRVAVDSHGAVTDENNEDEGIYGDLDVTGPVSIVHTGIRPASIVGYMAGERVIHVMAPGGLALDGLTITSGFANVIATDNRGGGILNEGFLTIVNTTIAYNSAIFGGGLSTKGPSTAILRNVTIVDNYARGDGGGISVETGGNVSLTNVTVANNTAGGGDGGGLFASTSADGGVLTMRNTLVADNVDEGKEADDCARLGGRIVSHGHNLIGNTNGCQYQAGPRDLVNRSAELTPLPVEGGLQQNSLRHNGGPTQTVALRKSSPAVDAGARCTATDQRGVKRRLGGRCDIGAWELVRCQGRVVNRVGTNGADLLGGTALADGFLALGGKDTMLAGGGKDGLCGGAGNDLLAGSYGADRLDGGRGRDLCLGGLGPDSGRRCELPRPRDR